MTKPGAAGMPARLVVAACSAAAMWASSSCRRGERAPAPPARAATVSHTPSLPGDDDEPPVSLAETVERLRAYHRQRFYARLEAYVAPQARVPFINTLMAMDRFVAANGELVTVLRREMDAEALRQWDLSGWAEAMGLFAPTVRVVSVRDDGRTGRVGFQVRRRLPLQYADFHWVNDRWVYDPGPAIPGLAPAINDLASAVAAVAREARKERLSAEALDTEFRLRIIPRLRAIQALAPTEGSSAGGDDR